MIYCLRYGVVALLVVTGLVCIAGFATWRMCFWQAMYVPLLPVAAYTKQTQPLPVDWQLAAVATDHLQQQMLRLFAPHATELQLQADDQTIQLSAQLPSRFLSLVADLPVWPGWHLELMRLQPQQEWWSLLLLWRQSGEGVKDSSLPQVRGLFAPAIWQASWASDESLKSGPKPSLVASVTTESDPPKSKINWQLMGYWLQDAQQGVWLRDTFGTTQKVLLGQLWQGFKLLTVSADGVTWQDSQGRQYRQALCRPLGACGAGA